MNGLYTEAELEAQEFWNPVTHVVAENPEINQQIDQSIALQSLAIHADYKRRLTEWVDGMEDYADAIEQAHARAYQVAIDTDMWFHAQAPAHQEAILIARALKDGLIETVRNLANSVAETYGV